MTQLGRDVLLSFPDERENIEERTSQVQVNIFLDVRENIEERTSQVQVNIFLDERENIEERTSQVQVKNFTIFLRIHLYILMLGRSPLLILKYIKNTELFKCFFQENLF